MAERPRVFGLVCEEFSSVLPSEFQTLMLRRAAQCRLDAAIFDRDARLLEESRLLLARVDAILSAGRSPGR